MIHENYTDVLKIELQKNLEKSRPQPPIVSEKENTTNGYKIEKAEHEIVKLYLLLSVLRVGIPSTSQLSICSSGHSLRISRINYG